MGYIGKRGGKGKGGENNVMGMRKGVKGVNGIMD